VKRDADISTCGRFRYTLSRTWAAGPRVCYIGHNPSTADADMEDPTTRAWAHFARINGYGGFVAVNLYPFRSSDPKACREWADFENNGPDWYARDVLLANIDRVAQVAKNSAIVVASWGALAQDEILVDKVLEEIRTGYPPYPEIYCLGMTASGAPKHPLARGRHRIPRDQKFIPWARAAAGEEKEGRG